MSVTIPRNRPREWGIRSITRELTGTPALATAVSVELRRGDGTVVGTYTAADDRAFGGWVAQIPALGLDLDVATLTAIETVTVGGVAHVARVAVTVTD